MRQLTWLAWIAWLGIARPGGATNFNPCSPYAIRAGELYHPYPPDRRAYVQCSEDGTAHLRYCPRPQRWYQHQRTCSDGPPALKDPPHPPPMKEPPHPPPMKDLPHPPPMKDPPHPPPMKYPPHPPPMREPLPPPPPRPVYHHHHPPPRYHYHPRPETTTATTTTTTTTTTPPPMMNDEQWVIEGPDPCDVGVRYVAHPADETRYLECVAHVVVERACPQGLTWHEGRCSQPPSICYNRFLPFPGDPRKYIVCENGELVVWDCGPNAYWNQTAMRCFGLPTLPPPTTTTTTAAPPPMSMCDVKSGNYSLYHPYPPNPARFIQCDEYGNMYIRQCGDSKIWHNGFKTCVLHLNVTLEVPNAAGDGAGNANPCPVGEIYDAALGLCVSDTVELEPPDVTFQNDAPGVPGELVSQIICPHQYYWQPHIGQCVQIQEDVASYTPNCEYGFLWDPADNMCVRAVRVDSTGALLPPHSNNAMPAQTTTPDPPPAITLEGDDNPCANSDKFYHKFPGEPRLFIQCNLGRVAYVRPCPSGLVWSDDVSQCLKYFEAVPPAPNDVLTDVDHNVLMEFNTCGEDSAPMHQVYPLDVHRFIMCANKRPYVMLCPRDMIWDSRLDTCNYVPLDLTAAEEGATGAEGGDDSGAR